MKSFALSLTFIVRFTATRKWPIKALQLVGSCKVIRKGWMRGYIGIVLRCFFLFSQMTHRRKPVHSPDCGYAATWVHNVVPK